MFSQEEKTDGQEILVDYVTILWRRKVWLLLSFLVGIILSVLLVFFLPKSYRSTTLILVEEQKIPEEFVRSTISGSVEGRLSTIRQQVLSRSFLQQIIESFGLFKGDDGPMEEKVETMRKAIEIKTMGGERVNAFSISFIGNHPMTTMNVTNELASLLIKENLKIREELVEGTTEFIDSELVSLKNTLEQQEQEISRFKQAYTGELPTQIDASLRTLDRLQLALQEVKMAIRSAEPIGAEDVDPLFQEWLDKKQELVSLQRRFNDNHPDLVSLKREVRSLEDRVLVRDAKVPRRGGDSADAAGVGRLSRGSSQQILELRRRESQVEAQIRDFERRIENAPKREQQLAILLRDYDNTQKNYQTLLDKKLTARISENLEKRQKGEQFRVVDPANFPEKPYRPDPIKMGILGCFLGLASGLGLVFMVEMMDTSIRKPEDLEKMTSIPVLASILDHDVFSRKLAKGAGQKKGKVGAQV
jgi:polysaccharide chain length determinant protein (PEP-CTERM system associated)